MMRSVKGLLCMLLLFFAAGGVCYGGSLQILADQDLDAVHARGLTFLIDANTFMQNGLPQLRGTNLTAPDLRNVTLANSLMITGSAQQGAMGVVNAVNSAVNMPINIVVLINSTANGGININNMLSAITGR